MSHKNKEMQILNLLRSIIISTIRLVPAWLPLSILILGFPPVTVAQLPCYDIHVTGDDIYCSNWLPNAVITLSIQPDGFYASTNTNSEGFAIFADIYDIQGGQTITISDGNTTIPYVVTNVLVDSVDTCNDTVSGTAAPDSIVYIEPWLDNRVPRMATVTDSTGHWIVDYETINFDILPGDRAFAMQKTYVYPIYCSNSVDWIAGDCVEYVGEILSLSGEVYVNDVRVQYPESMRLYLEDKLKTLANSRAEAKFGETSISLGENSSVTVAGTTTPTHTSLQDLYGLLRARVGNLTEQQYEVSTPVSVTSVRGTELQIESVPEETRIIMLEHEADVATPDGSQSIVLRELQGVIVTQSGIGEPYPVSPNEIERFWEQLVISVASPVNLYVTDPLGRHIGWSPTGEIVNEIPGATYTGPSANPEEINIPGPVQGNYDIELIAVGTGPYHLSIAGMGLGEETFLDEFSDTIEEPNEIISYQADYEQTEESLQVNIDIKPGSFPNAVNLRSRGRIPVAVLTDENFDATTVDSETVFFGIHGMEAEPVHHAFEDVDGDGDIDMIFHFRTQDTDIQWGDTSAYLRGFTLDGKELEGYDSIKPVGFD